MADWDAGRYHRLSDPQRTWGLAVLERLAPVAGERILDIGCGTGRLTSELLVRVPSAHVVGLDRSWTMLCEARRNAVPGVRLVQADAERLPSRRIFDAVFSTATFHWVADHERLFAEIHRVLRPGGRLVAQAGGGPNLARLYGRAATLMHDPQFAAFFDGWADPWLFATVEETRARMEQAGFTQVKVWLQSAETAFGDRQAFAEFVSTVCLRHHLDRLREDRRGSFLDRVLDAAASDEPPFTLDYWRLNIDGRR